MEPTGSLEELIPKNNKKKNLGISCKDLACQNRFYYLEKVNAGSKHDPGKKRKR